MTNENQKRVEKDLNKLFKKYKIQDKINVAKVKKWIWNASGDAMEASNKYHKKCIQLFPELDDIDELNNILQIFVSAWNTFPHKVLGGKAPNELFEDSIPSDCMDLNDNPMPMVRVGDQEMSFDEFQSMLEEMAELQIPFKNWIEREALPKYENYLRQMVKKKGSRENHYEVADIFFQRVLHVGFIILEDIRTEFIQEEFPHWWPTHVMSSNLNPSQVKNSLKRLFTFLELVYEIDAREYGFEI